MFCAFSESVIGQNLRPILLKLITSPLILSGLLLSRRLSSSRNA